MCLAGDRQGTAGQKGPHRDTNGAACKQDDRPEVGCCRATRCTGVACPGSQWTAQHISWLCSLLLSFYDSLGVSDRLRWQGAMLTWLYGQVELEQGTFATVSFQAMSTAGHAPFACLADNLYQVPKTACFLCSTCRALASKLISLLYCRSARVVSILPLQTRLCTSQQPWQSKLQFLGAQRASWPFLLQMKLPTALPTSR